MPVGDTPTGAGGPDVQYALARGCASAEELWQLARELSPRQRCRVDTRDHTAGEWRHAYRDAPLPADPDGRPTALYLTDAPATGAGRFHLLAFDLDSCRGDVQPDLHHLRQLLEDAGIPHVVAASGPTGGRHVWCSVGPAGADPDRVARIARSLASRLPTLDIAPLTNSVTGAVRPPGSPHRAGGTSALLEPATVQYARDRLLADNRDGIDRLGVLLELPPPAHTHDIAEPGSLPSPESLRAVVDAGGGPALSGLPTPLQPALADQLTTRPTGDASAALARILVGLALARWTWPMVLQLLADPTAHGIEHARTRHAPAGRYRGSPAARGSAAAPRDAATRLPRSRRDAIDVLRRQWTRAVSYAAQLPARPADVDPDLEGHLVAVVVSVQDRADQAPERWARPSGPADRGVLDALSRIALTCGSTAVDLDIRRAATLAGIGPATAARAFKRLALDGWIRLAQPADGRRAARWQLLPPTSSQQGETQPTHPPPIRSLLLDRLTVLGALRTLDLFAPRRAGGLGRHASRTAIALLDPHTLPQLVRKTGYSATTLRRHLGSLQRCGVATRRGQYWHLKPTRSARAARAARRLGVHGYRAERARSCAIDRQLWAWWNEELQWMHADTRWRRPATGQTSLIPLDGQPQRPPFPRRPDGRADYPTARATLLATYSSRPSDRAHLAAAA